MNHPPTALITGGARRIGAQLAEHLAARGYHLVLHYHRAQHEAETLAEHLRKTYQRTIILKQADLRQPESLTDFFHGLPACEVFIHNASMFARDTLHTMTPQSLRDHLALHVETPVLLAQGFAKQLPGDAKGSIILIGDGTMGWSIAPQFFSYSVSKHLWQSAIDVLAAACAPNIRANLLALGPTLTGEVDGDEVFSRLEQRAPLARTNTPEEVLAAVDYLISAPGVTGQVISLANGFGLAAARPI